MGECVRAYLQTIYLLVHLADYGTIVYPYRHPILTAWSRRSCLLHSDPRILATKCSLKAEYLLDSAHNF
jgi:hypothetical protein